jgi:hypothetical protein
MNIIRSEMVRDLAAIEARGYRDPLDHRRAAVLRASVRSIELSEMPVPHGIVSGMNRDREREHLVQVDRHIAECKTHIARQREIIQELVGNGQAPELAVSTLNALRSSLRGFEPHRAPKSD